MSLSVPPARRFARDRDDRGLAARAGAGDEGAFAILYDRHAPGLLGFVSQYLGDRGSAEDVVQQTFFAAFRVMNEGAELQHPRAWLYHVARNNALTAVRDRSPADVAAELADELHDRAAAVPTQVEQREALDEVVRDIVALPADQRAALALFELGDMSQAEIAKALACKPEKVKALVFQARAALTSKREARSASCETVREKLATVHGGALNHRLIRLHLRHCEPCTAYRDELRDRRRKVALLLPVLPMPGLRESVLGLFGSGTAAAAGAKSGSAGAALLAGGRARWIAAGTAASVAVAGVTLASWPTDHERREAVRTPPPPPAAVASTAPAVAPPKRAERPRPDPPRRRRAPEPKPAVRVATQPARAVVRAAAPGAPQAPRPEPPRPRPESPKPQPKPAPAAAPEPAATAAPAPEPVVVAAPPPPPTCTDHSNASPQGLANGQGHQKCNGRERSGG